MIFGRDEQGRIAPKGLDGPCHKFRFKKGQRERITKLKMGDINLMDFVRESVDHYLEYIERTDDIPALPSISEKKPTKTFLPGDIVLVAGESGKIICKAKQGWYRVEIIDSGEIKMSRIGAMSQMSENDKIKNK